jgi:hypothetical protein
MIKDTYIYHLVTCKQNLTDKPGVNQYAGSYLNPYPITNIVINPLPPILPALLLAMTDICQPTVATKYSSGADKKNQIMLQISDTQQCVVACKVY